MDETIPESCKALEELEGRHRETIFLTVAVVMRLCAYLGCGS